MGNSLGYGKAVLNLNDGVTAIYRHSFDETIDIGGLSGSSGSVLGAGGEASNIITWRIGTANKATVFNGIINDTQFKNSGAKTAIIKAGTGTLRLTNNNLYSGNTQVEEGTLLLNNSTGSGTGSGSVAVENGGNIGGTGIISGPLVLRSGAVVAPGDNGIGIFSVTDSVTFESGSYFAVEINSDDNAADMLKVNGLLKLGGILYIINKGTGEFQEASHFKILQSDSCTGNFSLIIPSSPGIGLKWDTTHLASTGYLSVVKATGEDIRKAMSDVRIFPNPSNGLIDIEFGFEMGETEMVVNDVTGRIRFTTRINGISSYHMDLSDLPGGIYFIQISSGDNRTIRKIIIE